jgi:tetratricopeptide (TPR) repeat protein
MEVSTVTAQQRRARIIRALSLGILTSGAVASLGAQQTARPGQVPGPRFMVPTFRSGERNLGLQAAEALRERMISDVPIKTLWIVPKTDIDNYLESSGYSKTEALNPNDTRQLAQLLRATEYVEGTITKTPAGGFHVDAAVLMVRGDAMVQPLPPVEATKLDQIAKLIADQVMNARKQMEFVNSCMDLSRQKKYPDALAAARKAIGVYPRSSLARVCIAEVYNEQKLGVDSMIKISEEVLAIHPQNRRALAFAADAYNAKKMDDKYIQALTTLLAADPTNTRLQTTVINALAGSGKADLAKPIVDDAVKQNPGDPQLIRLQWLIYLALKQWKGATAIGEEMVKTDTAAADTGFFTRMAAAYVNDSQPRKAAEMASRGIAKYPNNDNLALLQAQLLRQAGQTQQALEAINKLLARNPKVDNGFLQKSQIQAELKLPPDSIVATLKGAVQAGNDKTTIGGYATTLGQAAYKAGNASKNADDFRHAISYLKFAMETAPTDNAAFLMGVSSLSLGANVLQEANEKKSCELAKEAQAAFNDAQINLPRGGKAFPEPTKQALGSLAQLSSFPDRQIKAFCK